MPHAPKLGAAMTSSLFYLLLTGLAVSLLVQDRRLLRSATWGQLAHHFGAGHGMGRRTVRHLMNYLRPGFHPSGLAVDADAVAAAVLQRQATAEPPSVVPMPLRT